MQGKRTDRVGHLVQMELSQLILTRIRDPRLGFVTVTHVDMTQDLKSALVFYSVMGDKEKRRDSQAALEHATGFLQKAIGTTLKLRYTPKLSFQFDDSLNQGLEIDRLIQTIQKEETP